MHTTASLTRRGNVRLLLLWAAILLAATLFSVFLHEDGHGIGAWIDGIHLSTGFNKVGGYGKFPQDVNFLADMPGGFWAGLLGPIVSWGLTFAFTIWLYRFRTFSNGALMVGAMALVNGLIRALPMILFFTSAFASRLHMEDEVGWSLWYSLKFCHPELASLSSATLLKTQAGVLLADPMFWVPPLLSLFLSLACLIPANLRLFRLLDGKARLLLALTFSLLPLVTYGITIPILNTLDQVIRINW